MTCSCLVLATTVKSRSVNFLETLRSINAIADENLLSSRLISIDDFGEGLDKKQTDLFKQYKFEYIIEKRRGMVKSLRQSLDKIDTEWLLYCEDDVRFKFLPTKEEFDKIIAIELGGRECGIIGLCAGGYEGKYLNRELANKANYIHITNKLSLFKRDEQYKNHCFIDFPSTFIKTGLLKSCIDKAIHDKSHYGIEQGITTAWFDLKFNEKFHKVNIIRNPWMEDENAKMNINRYIKQLMPFTLNGKDHLAGGHRFGFK